MRGSRTVQDFDATEWSLGSETTVLPLELEVHHHVQVRVSCSKEVTLLGVCEEKEIPLQSGQTFRFRGQLRNFQALALRGTGKTVYGYSFKEIPRQDGEALSDEKPASPPLPGNDNLLLSMRRLMQQEHRRNMPPVCDPETDLPDRYTIEDDDFRFEEEIAQELASSQQNPQAVTVQASEPPQNGPAAAAEPPTQGSSEPGEPKVAAE